MRQRYPHWGTFLDEATRLLILIDALQECEIEEYYDELDRQEGVHTPDPSPPADLADWEVLAERDLATARKQTATSSPRLHAAQVLVRCAGQWQRFRDLVLQCRGVRPDQFGGTLEEISEIARDACRALALLPDTGEGRSLLARAAGLVLTHNRACVLRLSEAHTAILEDIGHLVPPPLSET